MKVLEGKRIHPYPAWLPWHKRLDRFGQPLPPRPAHPEIPLFWLTEHRGEILFINESDQVMPFLRAGEFGFETCDDEVVHRWGDEVYEYTDIQPHEAVLVAQINPYLDGVAMIELELHVGQGEVWRWQRTLPDHRRGSGEDVLCWQAGVEGDRESGA